MVLNKSLDLLNVVDDRYSGSSARVLSSSNRDSTRIRCSIDTGVGIDDNEYFYCLWIAKVFYIACQFMVHSNEFETATC